MLRPWRSDHREMPARTGTAVEEPARFRVIFSAELERSGGVATGEEHVLDLALRAPAMLAEVPQVQRIPLHRGDPHEHTVGCSSRRGQVDYTSPGSAVTADGLEPPSFERSVKHRVGVVSVPGCSRGPWRLPPSPGAPVLLRSRMWAARRTIPTRRRRRHRRPRTRTSPVRSTRSSTSAASRACGSSGRTTIPVPISSGSKSSTRSRSAAAGTSSGAQGR